MTTLFTRALGALETPWVDPAWLYAILQLGILVLFVIVFYRATRHSPARALELFTAVAFGLLLEEGDMILFQTYRYSPYWFAFDLVPPAIALTWALVIASAMNLSDALGIDQRVAPLADAVWAILLDLALDAVAIRLGLWNWTIPLDRGWFGVPYGNFYAWLWVAAMFSFFTRWVRGRAATRGARQALWQGAAPFIAYAGLLAAIFPYAFLQFLYFRGAGADWFLFAVSFAVFVILTIRATRARGAPREPADRLLMAARYLIHIYFLWAIVTTRMVVELPVLLVISLAMLAVETALVVVVDRASPRRLFAWKRARL